MKPIKCEVHEPCVGGTKISYHASIRKAMRYCKTNGLSYKCILPRELVHIWLYGKPTHGRSFSKENAHMALKGE